MGRMARVSLRALALPMTPEQLAIFQNHTGRSAPSTAPLHEAWLVCGRRSGKSFMLACIAVFLAAFRDWRPFLGPGEVATIMIIAADRRQARVIMRYCLGLLRAVPMLKQLIEGRPRSSRAAQSRCYRGAHREFPIDAGLRLIAALCDEMAYWPSEESAEPDEEILAAIRPGMARYRGQCCSARRHHTHAGAPCGTRTASISARTAIPSLCGRLPRAR